LEALGISKYFTSVIGHDIAPRGKPYPDMVYQACQQMNIQPEQSIIFGDSNGDMLLGKNSGLLAGIGVITHASASSSHLKDAHQNNNKYYLSNFKQKKLKKKIIKGEFI